jgi:hypothetical protein
VAFVEVFGSGMGKKSGSGIYIPDPQHRAFNRKVSKMILPHLVLNFIHLRLEKLLLRLELLHVPHLHVDLVHLTLLGLARRLHLVLDVLHHPLELPHVLLQLLLPLPLVLQLRADPIDLVLELHLLLEPLLLGAQLSLLILPDVLHADLLAEVAEHSVLHRVHLFLRVLDLLFAVAHRVLYVANVGREGLQFGAHALHLLVELVHLLDGGLAVVERVLETGLEALHLGLDGLDLGLLAGVLHGDAEIFDEFLLLGLELGDLFVVPALGLAGQVHRATGDDAGFLVECSVQGNSVVPIIYDRNLVEFL